MTRQRADSKLAYDEMTFDEQLAAIKKIREERRIVKHVPKRRLVAARVKKDKDKTSLKRTLGNLSPEELAALMKNYGVS